MHAFRPRQTDGRGSAPPPYESLPPRIWDAAPRRVRRNTEPESPNANLKMIAFFTFLVLTLGFLSAITSFDSGKAVVPKLSKEAKAHQLLKDRVERERIAWKDEQKKLEQNIKDDKKRDKVRRAMEKERLQWEKESKKREKLRLKYQEELRRGEEKWKQEQEKTREWLEKQKKEKDGASNSKT